MSLFFSRYFSTRLLLIMFLEASLVFGGIYLITSFNFNLQNFTIDSAAPSIGRTAILTVAYIAVYYYFNLYTPILYCPARMMVLKLCEASIVACIAVFSLYFLDPAVKIDREVLLAIMLLVPLLFLTMRLFFARGLKVKLAKRRVLIIGSGELAKTIGSEIYRHAKHGLSLVGFVDDDPARHGASVVNPGVIGGYGDIVKLTRAESIDQIIIALPDRRAKLPMSALLNCKLRGITIEEGATFNERVTGRIPLDQLKPSWMVFSDGFRSLRSRKIVERIFDIVGSIICLVILSPILLMTALFIKLDSKGPMLYKQKRVGENSRVFSIYKFRSMVQDAEAHSGPVWADMGDKRITRVGRVIRKLRIDETPQFINVLKGEMSLVGPRPERQHFVDQLKDTIPFYEMRTIVKPGITGWAQVKYPYCSSIHDSLEKLQYDVYYIKNMSPLLDLLIMLMTIQVAILGRGAR